MAKKVFLMFAIAVFTLFYYGATCLMAEEPDFTEKKERDFLISKEGDFIVLCYHDVPKELNEDKFGADCESFVDTLEYFKTHGYNFISIDDVIKARDGIKPLPENPVLLTFDDAYKSFYEYVLPIIRAYNVPCVLSVVTNWIEGDAPLEYLKNGLMTWSDLQKVAREELVTIASHTHDLHKGIKYNPQGNEAPAATNRIYYPETNTYEDEASYRRRLSQDFAESKRILKERLGVDTTVLTWPFGKFSSITVEEAKRLGFKLFFVLNDEMANLNETETMGRFLVYENPKTRDLLKDLGIIKIEPVQKRIVQVDLDLVYDEDPEQANANLGRLLDRIYALKPTTVVLQAFSDADGTGDVKSVYFPNRVLPMRGDYFNRAAHQIRTRAMVEVYAWMPMLSIQLPDQNETEALRVKEYNKRKKKIMPSTSWYKRLSPFDDKTKDILHTLYEDMAVNAAIDGVVFQDDGYLNDFEDFNDSALPYYKEITGGEITPPWKLSDDKMAGWTAIKTQKLIALTDDLIRIVKYYRPETKYARTLYAPVLTNPESEEWFAQNYEESLGAYDFVVVMAYPYLEKVWNPKRWLMELVDIAKRHPKGIEKTIFKIQTYDWERKKPIKDVTISRWLRYLLNEGARHVAYYPDNYIKNLPTAHNVRMAMSVEDFPFKDK
ncbi:MAG: poly-beta-1,6-N-acetyl-D-glucosamine N-deacetylase PgaB [Candidatus Omnitrophica bacterium]|nr:poly-beta-1,6-N-acetyl-D-glucosamine N-deacetylase PgaB [Candidatus Omnitrophota bacterium]